MIEIHELYIKLIDDIDKNREALLAHVNETNINEPFSNEGNRTLLHMAMARHDAVTALALLKRGAKWDLKDTCDFTAIDYAICTQNKQLLLEFNNDKKYNFDPNKPDITGDPPLYTAVRIGDINLIEFWLKLGADVHAIIPTPITLKNNTILRGAAKVADENHIFKMRLLLKWGIGIKNDFTGVNLYDDITEGCIILNSHKDDKPITRKTPGCENAYTNLEELKEALKAGKKINIMCKTSVFEPHFRDRDVYNIYKLLISTTTNTLQSKLLFFINDHPQSTKSLESLPDELKSEVAASIDLSSGSSS